MDSWPRGDSARSYRHSVQPASSIHIQESSDKLHGPEESSTSSATARFHGSCLPVESSIQLCGWAIRYRGADRRSLSVLLILFLGAR
jgi:hypothetical protein